MNDNFIWWRDGVIYQIYPRSFQDSNGDGLGDLNGITQRLDDLQRLGVDALWLSPFYPSPDKDFGYDVSDHTAVDPRMGSLEDFDHLVTEAHQRGIRIILDMVLNHTSDQHAWFQQARASRDNPKRDWYIWRDEIPNNWQASFGGPAWSFDESSGQYYLHSFLKQQPDLNWRNPSVRQAQLDVFRFWLARGVDGFRLDVFNAYFKDRQLRSNPPKFGLRAFDRQHHLHDMDQPEMIPLLREIRQLLDQHNAYAVGETYLASPEKLLKYVGADRFHAAFSFDFHAPVDLFPAWGADAIAGRLQKREALLNPAGIWPTNVMSNHDMPRAASRYCKNETDDAPAKLALALILTLPGTPFLYQGEEIGMRDIPLARHEILDPPGKLYWPFYKGRDGCRSPMQWDASPNAGFSTTTPWLKVHPNYPQRNLAAQQADEQSIYHFTRRLLALRRETPALVRGDFSQQDTSHNILLFERKTENQSVLVALNFGGPARQSLPAGAWELLFESGGATLGAASLHLPGQGIAILQKTA